MRTKASSNKKLNMKTGNRYTTKRVGPKKMVTLGSKNRGTSKLDGVTK